MRRTKVDFELEVAPVDGTNAVTQVAGLQHVRLEALPYSYTCCGGKRKGLAAVLARLGNADRSRGPGLGDPILRGKIGHGTLISPKRAATSSHVGNCTSFRRDRGVICA
jgi:hypothetical protein